MDTNNPNNVKGYIFVNQLGHYARESAYMGFGAQRTEINPTEFLARATVFSASLGAIYKTHPSLKSWQALQAVEVRQVVVKKWEEENDQR